MSLNFISIFSIYYNYRQGALSLENVPFLKLNLIYIILSRFSSKSIFASANQACLVCLYLWYKMIHCRLCTISLDLKLKIAFFKRILSHQFQWLSVILSEKKFYYPVVLKIRVSFACF